MKLIIVSIIFILCSCNSKNNTDFIDIVRHKPLNEKLAGVWENRAYMA